MAGAAAVVVFGCAAYGVSRLDIQRRKGAITQEIAAERAALQERPRALVSAMDDVILEAARTPWPGDSALPELATPEQRAALCGRRSRRWRGSTPSAAPCVARRRTRSRSAS